MSNILSLKPKKRKTLSSKLRENYKYTLKQYIYIINYPVFEESLCKMEIKHLFHILPRKKYFFSYHFVSPSRSVFIKQCLSIIYKSPTLEILLHQIKMNCLSFNAFKVSSIPLDKNLSFSERRFVEKEVGFYIKGKAEIHDPKIHLGVFSLDKIWVLGKLSQNDSNWQLHNNKPYSYCNSLSVRVARTLVNIAVCNNLSLSIVDPCCGVGTVVMEGLSLGIKIKGYEINANVANNGNENLAYFGYERVIINKDMHTIDDKFDVAIVDLPYGLFTPTTLEQQLAILKTSKKIADKHLIVTSENMDRFLLDIGFQIIDQCYVNKGKLKRYITICKSL